MLSNDETTTRGKDGRREDDDGRGQIAVDLPRDKVAQGDEAGGCERDQGVDAEIGAARFRDHQHA